MNHMTKIIVELWDDDLSEHDVSELIGYLLLIDSKTYVVKIHGLVGQKTTLKSGTMKYCIYKDGE